MASPGSSPPAATDRPTETLEVPTLPDSRFVLPPPPSDLMNRLQAFLPQMKAANDALAERMEAEGQAEQEEGVELQIVNSSDESSSDDSDSSDSDDEEEEEEQAADEMEVGETMAHLFDISARPKVVKKKLVEEQAHGKKDGAGIVEME
jgi:hypothetical protein